MADDSVAIQPNAIQPTSPVTLIKTFTAIDPTGKIVEIQAVVPTDERGAVWAQPLTEETGKAIYLMLCKINNLLNESTGCGAAVTPEIEDD